MNYYVAFWNVENLFDVEDSPNRTDKLNRTLKNELKGWNVSVLETARLRFTAPFKRRPLLPGARLHSPGPSQFP